MAESPSPAKPCGEVPPPAPPPSPPAVTPITPAPNSRKGTKPFIHTFFKRRLYKE